MHNDRVNSVQKLMNKYNNVDKFLKNKNQSEEALIDRLIQQEGETKKQAEVAKEEKQEEGEAKDISKVKDKKWK